MSENLIVFFIGSLLAIAGINFRYLFVTKNIFILYFFAIYLVSPLLLGNEGDYYINWMVEFLIVLLFYIFGYELTKKLNRKKRNTTVKKLEINRQILKIKQSRNLLIFILFVNFFFIGSKVLSVGAENYFSGSILSSSIENYGKIDGEGAVRTIIEFFLSGATLAIIALFAERHIVLQNALLAYNDGDNSSKLIRHSKKSVIIFSLIWYLIIPLLQIGRGALILGLLSILAVLSLSRIRISMLAYIFGIAVAIASFVYIGQSRENRLGAISDNSIQFHLASELTPWVGYNEIKQNISTLDFQYGSTIIIPFFTQFVPRAIWAEKPLNTTGYFNNVIHADAADKGFVLPITIMGALYLNFGILGVVFGVFALGLYCGVVDSKVCYKINSDIGFYLIGIGMFFGILRNDPSVSLFQLLSCLFVYYVLKIKIRT